MGQSGVRPIGNLFWDIGLIASYLLYWSLVVYPMTSDEQKYARIVHYLKVGIGTSTEVAANIFPYGE